MRFKVIPGKINFESGRIFLDAGVTHSEDVYDTLDYLSSYNEVAKTPLTAPYIPPVPFDVYEFYGQASREQNLHKAIVFLLSKGYFKV
jgi:hypothetical protein